ncbi:MAG: squalene synthase HpnC [Magnetococcales bacterium]|nr:squalene synthase HpnC [Magnetococcales bacterium]
MFSIGPIPPNLVNDFNYCRQVVRSHAENFPVGSRLAPRSIRPFLHAVYAFSRRADDFADAPGRQNFEKLMLLDDWGRRLENARLGHTDHPIFRALAFTFSNTPLSIEHLRNLLIAFRMDVTNKRYDTLEELAEYCQYSANPIGRIVLSLAEEETPENLHWADAICTALQLTNHLQDLGEDVWKGRPLYLPREEMERFGVSEEMILQRRYTPTIGSLVISLVEQTRELFLVGEPLLKHVQWPLNLELAITWEAGMIILERIEMLGGNTFRTRPRLTGRDKAHCFWRAMGQVNR